VLEGAIGLLVMGVFTIWGIWRAESLSAWSVEDGPLENLTAVLFGLSAIAFVGVAARSDFLRGRPEPWRYVATLGWAALMLVFMGEELSWGQRLVGFAPPESVSSINTQGEFNVHNIELLDRVPGGTYRLISAFMILVGVVFPLAALTVRGKKVVQSLAFPVVPVGYAVLFVGAYLFGRFYHPIDAIAASEVRELLLAVGMFCFAVHGMLHPCAVFRVCGVSE
jgi:hypothetical protein